MPFLSIVTRTYRRPEALKRCQHSIAMQADQDLEHLIVLDRVGVGVEESHRLLLDAKPTGAYVLILDDDNLLASPRVVLDLKEAAEEHDPDVIVFKMRSPPFGRLPDRHAWEKEPAHGHIAGSNVAVKSHVWNACIWAIATDGQGGPPVYHSDLYYLEAVWRYTDRIHWLNKIAVSVPRVNRGRMECE